MPDQLKGVLFDFDDTLVDWSGVNIGWREIETARLASVINYVRSQLPGCEINVEEMLENYWERTRAAWTNARVNLRAPIMPDLLLATLKELDIRTGDLDSFEVLRAYDWQAIPGTEVFADVPPVLELLQEHDIKLGIVTNASQPMWMRDAELRAFGIIDYFSDCRLSAADVGYLKPHGRIFKSALEKMGTRAEETVFVGDNPVADIGGAQAAGMLAVRRFDPNQLDDGHLANAHPAIHSLIQLPAILDRWYPGWRKNGK